MKNLSTLLLFTLMFTVVSCGGGKGSAKLEISRGFVAVNDSFDGGFIVHGKETVTGDEFQVGISSGDTINVSIPYGTYNIKVVGWDNGTTPFEGPAYCGKTTFAFNEDGALLKLNVATSLCNDNAFSASIYRNAFSLTGLSVQNCGALYSNTNPTLLNSAITSNTCLTYPQDFQNAAPRYKLIYENKTPLSTATPGLVSECNSTQSLSTLRIPTSFPYKIELYNDTACTSLLKTFDFANGLEASYSAFHKTIHADSASLILKLPSASHDRALTPFLTEIPGFRCGFTGFEACHKIQNSGVNTSYLLDVGYFQRVKLPGKTLACADSNFSAMVAAGVIYDSASCVNYKGNTYIRVRKDAPGSVDFTYDGTAYEFQFGHEHATYGGSGNSNYRERKLYQTLKTVLGYNFSPGNHDVALQDEFLHDGKRQYGVLSEVRDILSPYGAGGLFFDQTCSETSVGTPVSRTMEIYNPDGTTSTIRAILTNPAGTAPPHFVYNNTGPTAMTSDSAFNRRIIIRKVFGAPAVEETTAILDFDCDMQFLSQPNPIDANDKRIGRLETQSKETLGTTEIIEKKVVYWNTTLETNSRFDVYRTFERNVSSVTQEKSHEFYRAEKFADGGSNNQYRISALTWNSDRNGSGQDSSLSRFEIDVKKGRTGDPNSMVYSFKELANIKLLNSAQLGLFNSPVFPKEMTETLFGYQFGKNQNAQGELKMNPDGKFVHAYPNGTAVKLQAYDGTTYYPQNLTNLSPTLVATDISANGSQKVVATAISGGTTIRVDAVVAGAWVYRGTVAAPGSGITDLKIAVKDNGDYVIGVIDIDDSHLYLAYALNSAGSPSVPGSFSRYFSSADTDVVLEMELVKTGTDIFVLHNLNEQMTAESYIFFCAFDFATPDCPVTYIQTLNGEDQFSDLSAHIYPGTSNLKVSFYDVAAGDYVACSSAAPSLPGGCTHYSDLSIRPFTPANFTTYYSTQLQWATFYDGHAFVPTPFVKATEPNFKFNFLSLDPTNFGSLFTNEITFDSTGAPI